MSFPTVVYYTIYCKVHITLFFISFYFFELMIILSKSCFYSCLKTVSNYFFHITFRYFLDTTQKKWYEHNSQAPHNEQIQHIQNFIVAKILPFLHNTTYFQFCPVDNFLRLKIQKIYFSIIQSTSKQRQKTNDRQRYSGDGERPKEAWKGHPRESLNKKSHKEYIRKTHNRKAKICQKTIKVNHNSQQDLI